MLVVLGGVGLVSSVGVGANAIGGMDVKVMLSLMLVLVLRL